MELNNVDYVLLAHHKDDTIENIFTNIYRGRSILNLAVNKRVLGNTRCIYSTTLLNVYKSEDMILLIEHYVRISKIPLRYGLYEECIETYYFLSYKISLETKIKQNLLNFNQETIEWNTLISNQIVEPFLNACVYDNNMVQFGIDKYDYPLCFWNTILMKIFYKFQHSCPSRKSILNFMCFIKNKTEGTINLSAKCKCVLIDGIIELTFNCHDTRNYLNIFYIHSERNLLLYSKISTDKD